jgi:hypothetical protein
MKMKMKIKVKSKRSRRSRRSKSFKKKQDNHTPNDATAVRRVQGKYNSTDQSINQSTRNKSNKSKAARLPSHICKKKRGGQNNNNNKNVTGRACVAWGYRRTFSLTPFVSRNQEEEEEEEEEEKKGTHRPPSSIQPVALGPPRNKIIFKHPNVVVSPFISFSNPPFISLRYSLASLLVRKFSVIEPFRGGRSPSWQSSSPG